MKELVGALLPLYLSHSAFNLMLAMHLCVHKIEATTNGQVLRQYNTNSSGCFCFNLKFSRSEMGEKATVQYSYIDLHLVATYIVDEWEWW